MPKQQKSGNKRAQGGGRTPNSEPRLQVFRDFAGINFEHSPRSSAGKVVNREQNDDADQTNLQMNYVYLQNNVSVVSDKTLETRDDIVEMFSAPSGLQFTGPATIISSFLYLALSNGDIGKIDLRTVIGPTTIRDTVDVVSHTGKGHTWTSFDYYDDKLIAMTSQGELWTGDVSRYNGVRKIENAREIPNPTSGPSLSPVGSGMYVSTTETEQATFRVSLCQSFVNKYGPTKVSNMSTFYVNKPVSEWSTSAYCNVVGTIPSEYERDILAVEVYFAADNAEEPIFLGRTDRFDNGRYELKWYGYSDVTDMWPMANLIASNANYTKGAPGTHVCNIDGRLYFWGDPSRPERLYIGGNPGNLLSVSPGTGGGFVDVEPGTGQEIRYVCKYKTQSGNSIVTMLCASQRSSKEQRFNLVENSITLSNEQSMKSWQAEQVAGAVGCQSFDGAIVCEDGLYSVSRYGVALTTQTMEYNSQIQANYVSDAIKPVFSGLDMNQRLRNSILLECDGTLYMALGIKQRDRSTPLLTGDAWMSVTESGRTVPHNEFDISKVTTGEGVSVVGDRISIRVPSNGYDLFVGTTGWDTDYPAWPDYSRCLTLDAGTYTLDADVDSITFIRVCLIDLGRVSGVNIADAQVPPMTFTLSERSPITIRTSNRASINGMTIYGDDEDIVYDIDTVTGPNLIETSGWDTASEDWVDIVRCQLEVDETYTLLVQPTPGGSMVKLNTNNTDRAVEWANDPTKWSYVTFQTTGTGEILIGYRWVTVSEGQRHFAPYELEVMLSKGTYRPYVPKGCIGITFTSGDDVSTAIVPLPRGASTDERWAAGFQNGPADKLILDAYGNYEWQLHVAKIDSYDGEDVGDTWVSSTGSLSRGAKVYYSREYEGGSRWTGRVPLPDIHEDTTISSPDLVNIVAYDPIDLSARLDNVLFCYDIALKAWWTHTLDVESTILKLFHMDWYAIREGIGIVTSDKLYMLPTTVPDDLTENADHTFLIETAELSTQMPKQGWQYLSQLEFYFDYMIGEMDIHVRATDMFGRKIHVRKHVSEETVQYGLVVPLRVDQRIMSYVITLSGTARFRLTHFIAKVYTLSNKIGLVWGFDDSISHRSAGSVHPTFKCYNDVRDAIFT